MPITYEDLQFSVALGRGLVVDIAPEHVKIDVGVVASNAFGISLGNPGHIKIGWQVEYEITGYDPTDATLTLHLVHDWRPGQKDDPNATTEPTDDLDITPYLVVHRYRTDRGNWAWCYRCWGDSDCDGHLTLDLSDRTYAERKARQHLATAHAQDNEPTQH